MGGNAAAKAFGGMLPLNKTLQTLDLSNNSFGKPALGDQVKHVPSGRVCTVNYANVEGTYIGVEGDSSSGYIGKDFEWKSQMTTFCAGVAASQSLTSVSDFLACTSCFFFLHSLFFSLKSGDNVAQCLKQQPGSRGWQGHRSIHC